MKRKRWPSLPVACSYSNSHDATTRAKQVPLYIDPLNKDYENLIQSLEVNTCLVDSFHGTVLTGPRSGPPNVTDYNEDDLYRPRFAVVANTQQWVAFGYVTTAYGARPIQQVIDDIRCAQYTMI